MTNVLYLKWPLDDTMYKPLKEHFDETAISQ